MKKSKVIAFSDDQEIGLIKVKDRFGKKSREFGRTSEAKYGKAIITYVESSGVRKKGDKKPEFKGRSRGVVGLRVR